MTDTGHCFFFHKDHSGALVMLVTSQVLLEASPNYHYNELVSLRIKLLPQEKRTLRMSKCLKYLFPLPQAVPEEFCERLFETLTNLVLGATDHLKVFLLISFHPQQAMATQNCFSLAERRLL